MALFLDKWESILHALLEFWDLAEQMNTAQGARAFYRETLSSRWEQNAFCIYSGLGLHLVHMVDLVSILYMWWTWSPSCMYSELGLHLVRIMDLVSIADRWRNYLTSR